MSRSLILFLGVAALAGCATEPPLDAPSPRAVLDAHAREVHALTFSPNGLIFATAGGKTDLDSDEVSLWVTGTGEHRLTFANYRGRVSALAFSPDGKLLAVGGDQGRIVLLEVESGTERLAFTGKSGRVVELSFSFDGKVLVSVSISPEKQVEIRRWEAATGDTRGTLESESAAVVSLAPDGGALAWVVSGESPGLRILDIETNKTRTLARIGITPEDPLIFAPDGKWLAAVHREEWNPLPNHCPYLYLVEVATGRVRLRSPKDFGALRGLAVSHDAQLLARGIEGGLELSDLKTLELRATVDESWYRSRGAELLEFSPDDKTLLTSDGRGRVLLWDVARLRRGRKE